ncbi:hypothetical protein C1X77_25980 [Pseudomonas sp. GW531-E2]|nr:hypothetical protein C1X77_25980 [Pseudomonas sp. GW531-E2]
MAKIAVDMVFELLIVAVAICALFSIGTVTTAAVVAAIAIVMLPINQYFRHRVEILLELHNRFVDRA